MIVNSDQFSFLGNQFIIALQTRRLNNMSYHGEPDAGSPEERKREPDAGFPEEK